MHRKQQLKDRYVVGRTLSGGIPNQRLADLLHPDEQVQPIRPIKKSRLKKFLLLLFLLLIIPTFIIGGWNAYNYSRASQKIFSSPSILSALFPATLEGESRGRVNIIVIGYSADDPEHGGATLTDAITILSLSTVDKTGYMLSIPRDLYVSIPGSTPAKINEAYQRGEISQFSEQGYSAGGIGLLEKTIAKTFGIEVDYHALVNYAAVREITDSLGGITVNIAGSDVRGIYDPNFQPQEGGPLRLSNGSQKLDGQTALRLTRARGAAGGYGLAQSDFDRTKNQQAVLLAIKNTLTWKLLLNPTKNSKLLNAVAENVQTDIEINEALPLYRLWSRVPATDMKSVNLRDINGQNMLSSYTTPRGQLALIPVAGLNDFSDIQTAIKNLDH